MTLEQWFETVQVLDVRPWPFLSPDNFEAVYSQSLQGAYERYPDPRDFLYAFRRYNPSGFLGWCFRVFRRHPGESDQAWHQRVRALRDNARVFFTWTLVWHPTTLSDLDLPPSPLEWPQGL